MRHDASERRKRLLAGLYAFFLLVHFAPATAQTTEKPASSELQEIERALAERTAEEARLKDEAAARENELKALRRQMIDTAGSLQSAETKIGEISAEIGRLETEEATLTTALKARQSEISDVLGALQSLERSKPPALLVSPDDANEAARIAMLLGDAAPALERKAAELRGAIAALTAIRNNLNAERASFEATNQEISERRDVLAELVATKQSERDVAQRLAAAAQRETAALAARATSVQGILERLERFARSITPRLKPAAPEPKKPAALAGVSSPSAKPASPRAIAKPQAFRPPTAFADARGALPAPVAGKVTGKFGARRPEGGRFDGLRFAASDNAIVTAPFDADIAFARSWAPIGNLVVLDVGDGYHILIMGLGAFLVEEGQGVAAGEPLGTMIGDAAQLDLEIRKNGKPVNPALWLSSQSKKEIAF
ncbi:MAG: peptidoglycan DD-metalloendopeptidase family protein [Pseudomonadota bacterium]